MSIESNKEATSYKLKHLLSDGLKYGANEPGFDEDKSGVRYIRITDLDSNGGLRDDTFKSLTFEKAFPYLLKEGDILLARSGATVGKSFIYRESHGRCCYAGYLIRARLDRKKILPEYFKFYTESFTYWDYISSSNIQATIQNVSAEKYAGLRIPIYDLEKQKEIVEFLNYETLNISQLIEKKNRFSQLTSDRINSLVDKAISNPNLPKIRFENAVNRMQREVHLSEHEELTRLGLYNRGRGIFKKPAADEEGMGDSNFFFVEEGDLIISGQFAWEGAVAIATTRENGCVVSHRYPVYRGKNGIKTAYILGLLRSDLGDFLLNEASRGSAGRNRPLNAWRLGKEKIPIADTELQSQIEKAINYEIVLKEKNMQSILLLEELRKSIITKTLLGQLDIKAWKKKRGTDKRLDDIEEAMVS